MDHKVTIRRKSIPRKTYITFKQRLNQSRCIYCQHETMLLPSKLCVVCEIDNKRCRLCRGYYESNFISEVGLCILCEIDIELTRCRQCRDFACLSKDRLCVNCELQREIYKGCLRCHEIAGLSSNKLCVICEVQKGIEKKKCPRCHRVRLSTETNLCLICEIEPQ